jgi:hypothetical protein
MICRPFGAFTFSEQRNREAAFLFDEDGLSLPGYFIPI